jgi:hypothetical protein
MSPETTPEPLSDVDRARALLDGRDGELRADIRGDVAALALEFRAIRREEAASRSAPAPAPGEAVGALATDPDPYLLAALGAAADGLHSAATYLRHVSAFAFAEQVEIDEHRARAALSRATTATTPTKENADG